MLADALTKVHVTSSSAAPEQLLDSGSFKFSDEEFVLQSRAVDNSMKSGLDFVLLLCLSD
eukprot:6461472-Amphidinium_carterae.1